MTNLGLSSTLGFVIPKNRNESIPGNYNAIDNPSFIAGVETYVGAITIGEDTFTYYNTREYGDAVSVCYKNGVRYAAPYTATGGVVGFGAQYIDSTTLQVYILYNPNQSTETAQSWYSSETFISPHEQGIPYYALIVYNGPDSVLVPEEEWDTSPSEDPEDPENMLPQGGEYADRMFFGDTDLQTLTELPNVEATMNMSYGGMLRTYVLSQADLTAVSSVMFSNNFWTNLKNKFEGLSDPLSMIVNCIQIPIAIGSYSSGTFRIGGVEMVDDNNDPVTVAMTTSRYQALSFGSVTLKEVWGTAKDYSDCSISIYLPYVGVKELDPDIVVGTTITLSGVVDFWTGDVLYLLHVSNADATKKYFTAQSYPYRWAGNCGKTIPIGRVDTTNKILGMIGAIAGISTGVMLGGVGVAGSLGATGLASSGMAGATAAGFSGLGTAKIGLGIAGATAAKALHSGFKPTVQSSSGVSGAPGQMDLQYAYIMVKRGVPKYPNDWRAVMGAPNYQTFTGTAMTGYTLFSEIHLTGMGDASEEERAELERILCEEGVIL